MPSPPRTVIAVAVALVVLVAPLGPAVAASAAPTPTERQPDDGDDATTTASNPRLDVFATTIPESAADAGIYRWGEYGSFGDEHVVDPDDAVVLTVSADGLHDRVEAENGSLDERVLAALDGETELVLRQTEASTPVNRELIELELNASTVDVTEPDVLGADRYHLVVDVDALAPVEATDRPDPLGWRDVDGSRFAATLSADDGTAVASTAPISFVPRTVPIRLRDRQTAVAAFSSGFDVANATPTDLADRFRADESPVAVHRPDTLALAVHVDGLDDRVDAANGSFDERVLAALDASGNLTVVSTGASGLNHDPGTLWLNASVATAARGSTSDTYVLLVDADAVAAVHALSDRPRLVPPPDADPEVRHELYDGNGLQDTYRLVADDFRSRPFRFERENTTVAAWRVPHHVDAANASASDLASYRDDDASGDDDDADDAYPVGEPAVTVNPADRLAVAVHVPGLDASVANASGNETERVLAALNATGHFAVVQTDETTTPERQRGVLWLNASNVRALDAPGTDRYVLVVDPEGVLGARSDPTSPPEVFAETYARGDEYYRFFGVYEEYAAEGFHYTARYYANDSESGLAATSADVAFRRALASVDDGLPLDRSANATVTGATTVAPGTALLVTASTDAGVTATDRVRVAENGTFTAALDLTAVDRPTVANVTVALAATPNRTLGHAGVPVREPVARIEFRDQTSTTEYVTARAKLTHGGTLVLRNDSGVVDTSTALAPSRNQTVTFTVPETAANGTYTVVAYRVDDDGDRTSQYPEGTVTATLDFALDDDGDDGDSDDDTTTRTTTATTAATAGTTSATAGTTTTTTVTTTRTRAPPSKTPVAQPGFGALAVLAALAALVGVVLARRQ